MLGAVLLGLVAGIVARVLMPRDFFRHMSGPASWAVSLGVGLLGALVGYVIFTVLLGIGDTDIFDWGGILSAIIGTLIVLPILGWFLRRRASTQPQQGSTSTPPPSAPPPSTPPPSAPPPSAPPPSAPPPSAPPPSAPPPPSGP